MHRIFTSVYCWARLCRGFEASREVLVMKREGWRAKRVAKVTAARISSAAHSNRRSH